MKNTNKNEQIVYGDLRPLYLLSEKGKPSCERLGKVAGVSGDTILRSISTNEIKYTDIVDMFDNKINKELGTLTVDDSVQDRLRSYENKAELITRHYSGNHKSIVNGVDLVTLFWTTDGYSLPINYRIYDPKDNKTKHDLFREMLEEVLIRGYKPLVVTADSFYSTNETVTKLIQKGIGLFMAVKSNRLARDVYNEGEEPTHLKPLVTYSIQGEGRMMHLKGLGLHKVFMFGTDRYYIYHDGKDINERSFEETKKITRSEVEKIHRDHRGIEEYHRVLKQLCNFEGMIFRNPVAIRNHIFYSIKAFCILEFTKTKKGLTSWYKAITNQTIDATRIMMSKLSIDGLYLVY